MASPGKVLTKTSDDLIDAKMWQPRYLPMRRKRTQTTDRAIGTNA